MNSPDPIPSFLRRPGFYLLLLLAAVGVLLSAEARFIPSAAARAYWQSQSRSLQLADSGLSLLLGLVGLFVLLTGLVWLSLGDGRELLPRWRFRLRQYRQAAPLVVRLGLSASLCSIALGSDLSLLPASLWLPYPTIEPGSLAAGLLAIGAGLLSGLFLLGALYRVAVLGLLVLLLFCLLVYPLATSLSVGLYLAAGLYLLAAGPGPLALRLPAPTWPRLGLFDAVESVDPPWFLQLGLGLSVLWLLWRFRWMEAPLSQAVWQAYGSVPFGFSAETWTLLLSAFELCLGLLLCLGVAVRVWGLVLLLSTGYLALCLVADHALYAHPLIHGMALGLVFCGAGKKRHEPSPEHGAIVVIGGTAVSLSVLQRLQSLSERQSGPPIYYVHASAMHCIEHVGLYPELLARQVQLESVCSALQPSWHRQGVELIQASVLALDAKHRVLSLQPLVAKAEPRQIRYAELIVAEQRRQPALAKLPRMSPCFMRSSVEVLALRAHLLNLFATNDAKRPLLRVYVLGESALANRFALSILSLYQQSRAQGAGEASRLRVCVVGEASQPGQQPVVSPSLQGVSWQAFAALAPPEAQLLGKRQVVVDVGHSQLPPWLVRYTLQGADLHTPTLEMVSLMNVWLALNPEQVPCGRLSAASEQAISASDNAWASYHGASETQLSVYYPSVQPLQAALSEGVWSRWRWRCGALWSMPRLQQRVRLSLDWLVSALF